MKTCEEYVLNELDATKKENAELKKQLAEMETRAKDAEGLVRFWIEKVEKAMAKIELKEDETFIKIYIDGCYATLVRKDDLAALKDFIELKKLSI